MCREVFYLRIILRIQVYLLWSKEHLKFYILKKSCVKCLFISIVFSGPNTFNENETIAKYEIMDGAPVRGNEL